MATALVVSFGATVSSASAGAAASWTVTPAGAYTAHAVYPTLDLPYMSLECDYFDVAAGTLEATGVTGGAIGTIDAIAIDNCSVGGLEFVMTQSTKPWQIDLVGPNASHANWADVTISGISGHWEGFSCSADFSGMLFGHYENDTGNLVIDGTGSDLVVSNADCLGLMNEDDVISMNASLHMAMTSDGTSPVISTP
ncbi:MULTISPECIES: hypothetical protein [unclassified Streptomyces]|uniref:hypothetical protein n=1 Tax=unclassified Streptomyces TaxID=2593676 RepID=UPI00036C6674|nr:MULTISPECIES: hypothetical protein [unclassified Streptomyces]MYQ76164.1 hypothetical protein [Streptomyces sp. SID4923]